MIDLRRRIWFVGFAVRGELPRTLAEAIAKGFEISGEEFHGELSRRGHFTLQRADKSTGDCEYLTVPFTAKLKVGPPRGYRIERHAYQRAGNL